MRDRRTIIYLLLISTFLLSMITLIISAETTVETGAKAYALYNPDTNTFISGKNINLKLPMASTTKILTALIAVESLDFDETITVPKEATGIEGSSLYLEVNDRITVRDLVYSVLLQSANDAATVLALRIGGTIEGFASIMNERAVEIGATDSSFENPHGLDSENHYTTAHDLALISSAALNNSTFRKISSTYRYSFSIGDKTRTVVNHNKLLKQYDGCIGVKTGYTKKCGRCLVSAAVKDGVTLIAVTLSDQNDWADHKKLLDHGFSVLESVDILSIANLPSTLPVVSGNKERVKIGVKPNEQNVVKYRHDEKIKLDIQLTPYITKNLKIGDIVGKIILETESGNREIEIISLEDVKIKKTKFPFFAK